MYFSCLLLLTLLGFLLSCNAVSATVVTEFITITTITLTTTICPLQSSTPPHTTITVTSTSSSTLSSILSSISDSSSPSTSTSTSTSISSSTSSSPTLITSSTSTSKSSSTSTSTSTLISSSTSTSSLCPSFVTPTCAKDNCLKAVEACDSSPGPLSALKDCSSYAQVTVTPLAIVVITTIYHSSTTHKTVYTTLSQTETTTTLSTLDVTSRTSMTVISYITTNVYSTSTSTDYFPTTTTTTKSSVAAATVTQSGPTALNKRADLIPTYAAACSGADLYSSACSCLGVIATTHTASAPTSSSTVYVIESMAIISTVTSTFKALVTSTYVSTQTVVETPTTTKAETVTDSLTTVDSVSEALTSTSTTVDISTSTTTKSFSEPTPTCNQFYLQQALSQYNGDLVQYEDYSAPAAIVVDDNMPTGVFTATSSGELILVPNGGFPLSVVTSGSLYTIGPSIVFFAPPGYNNELNSTFAPLLCNADGTYLDCTYPNGTQGVFSVFSTFNNYLLFYYEVLDNYTPIQLAIEPACGVP